MDVLLDDIVTGVLDRVQHDVVPTLENVTKRARKKIFAPRPPPKSTDLCYLTDRLIVSSRPSPANPPTFHDTGRDDNHHRRRRRRRPHPPKSVSSSSTPPDEQISTTINNGDNNSQQDDTIGDRSSTVAATESPRREVSKTQDELDATARSDNQLDDNDDENRSDNPNKNDFTMTTENPQEGGLEEAEQGEENIMPLEMDGQEDMQRNIQDDTSNNNRNQPQSVHNNKSENDNDVKAMNNTETTTSDENSKPNNEQLQQSEEEIIQDSKHCTSDALKNNSEQYRDAPLDVETKLTRPVKKDGSGTPTSEKRNESNAIKKELKTGSNDAPDAEEATKPMNTDESATGDSELIHAADKAPSDSTQQSDELSKATENDESQANSSSESSVPLDSVPSAEEPLKPVKSDDVANESESQSNPAHSPIGESVENIVPQSQEISKPMEIDGSSLNEHQADQAHHSSGEPVESSVLKCHQSSVPKNKSMSITAIHEQTVSKQKAPGRSTPPPTDDDDVHDDDENDHNPLTTSQDEGDSTIKNVAQHEPSSNHEGTVTKTKPVDLKNSPADITGYLDNRHGRNRYLAFSLEDEVPDDRSLLLFRRQIVQLGWWSPCTQRSETPSIPRILQACYAIHAFLQLNPSNVALVYCKNGKTRTAIVVSCYLKFSGVVQHAYEGFLHFLTKKGIKNPEGTWKQLPPSLHLFFRQFDAAVEMGCFLNRKPLLLRAIALQGIPVEDKPCIDIWDSSQRHIYTSHPEIWDKDDPVRRRMSEAFKGNTRSSQWADEEGFYKVNAVLDGDFLLLCRFGGDFAEETTVHDPSKILFRYANTTGFLSGGCPYELPAHKVDLMRQYANHLTDDDFLVTLLFEADWERISGNHFGNSGADNHILSNPSNTCSEKVWKSHEPGASEEGMQIIFQRHSANPDGSDIRNFKLSCRSKRVSHCKEHLLCLALQLSNFDYNQAEQLVNNTPSISWWSDLTKQQEGKLLQTAEHAKNPVIKERVGASQNESNASQKILDMLMDIDVSSSFESPDVEQCRKMENHPVPKSGVRDQASNQYGVGHGVSASQGTLPNGFAKDTGWIVPSISYPRLGDIVESFGSKLPQPQSNSSTHLSRTSRRRPTIPFFHLDRQAVIPTPAKKRRDDQVGDNNQLPLPHYNQQQEAATEVLMRLRHTGVSLSGLLNLAQSSHGWSDVPTTAEDPEETVEETEEKGDTKPPESKDVTMNREAKEMQEKKWKEATEAEAKEKEAKKQTEKDKKAKAEAKKEEEAKEEQPKHGEPSLKDDPDYAKYFKMLKMGMVKEQVLHAMKRDEKDPAILDLDPNKDLKSQLSDKTKPADGDVPLKDDPEFAKYFKMLKMGLPVGAVKNALTRDEKDPTIMDLDPNKNLKSQRQPTGGDDDGPPLKEDAEYQKYFKMLKMGLPIGAVKQALTKDGKDPSIVDLDPEKSLKSQTGSSDADDGPPFKDDPDYSKYFKMLAMGLPVGAVKNALSREGKDPSIMDLDPNKSVKSQLGGNGEDTGPPLKEDPDYAKYFKMLAMGLPLGAVKNALSRDGKDPSIMDLNPNKSLKSQTGGSEEKDTGIPLKDDPDYTKYFKMSAMGLPPGAVKNAMERDGKNPAVLDLDPKKSVAFQMKKKGAASKKPAKKKKRVRRKKIYWNPIDPGKMKEDSMWSIVRGSVVMDKLNYDPKEFEDLFTESADPADNKKKKKNGGDKAAKKLVQVIDGKRSMNGGIILARLKTDYSKIAGHVDKMDHGKFDSTQLKALKEYLADQDERRGLMAYMEKGKTSPDVKEKLYSEFSETEKYMWTMMDVNDAPEKFDTLLFRSNFKTRFEDISSAIQTLNAACDELRSSPKLRKLMAIILTVVNQINTGGEGKMAAGFTLDALLKLNEAKAFDKKTSVLHYVVKLVKKNDETLITFSADLGSIHAAENVILDGLNADVSSLGEELSGVHETVKKEADRLEQAGELKPMTLADLKEQKTVVKQVGATTQYNQTDHLTGRTSMERFTVNAKVACEEASDSIADVKKKYAALVRYFDEDEQIATADFFGIFRRFIVEWKKAVEQVEAIEKKEAKEKKRAAAKAAKEAKKAAAKAGKASDTGSKEKKHANLPKLLKRSNKAENPAVGGIAAAAAAAASSKSSKKSEPPMGIAAAAAAAASKNLKKSEPPMGIAAAAAMAASKKLKKPAAAVIGGSGIAAAAALAASKKLMKPVADVGRVRHSTGRGRGGLLDAIAGAGRGRGRGGGGRGGLLDAIKHNGHGGGDAADGFAATAALAASPPNTGVADESKALEASPENREEKSGEAQDDEIDASALAEPTEKPIEGDNRPLVDSYGLNRPLVDREGSTFTGHEANDDESKAGFAAKAAAYRKRKGKKDDKGEFETSPKTILPTQKTLDRETVASISNIDVYNADDNMVNPKTLDTPTITDEGESASEPEAKLAATQKPSSDNLGSGLASFLEKNASEVYPGLKASQNSKTSTTVTGLASFLERNASESAQNSKPVHHGSGLATFLDRNASHETRKQLLDQNLDDSSVAMLAFEHLQKQPLDPRMSTTWTEGDTIPNWMNWANQAIKSSDTESVRGFEMSRDLNDMNDYDDDSTIATYNDDMSIASASITPKRISSFISFENGTDPLSLGSMDPPLSAKPAMGAVPDTVPPGGQDVDPMPTITPAKVAASILFADDSTASTVDKTPSKSNVHRGRDQDLVDMGLSFTTGDLGLDAGLSFADDVGLDDGLGGFGGDFGGGFGGESNNLNGGEDGDAEGSDKQRKWFPWAKK